MIQCWTEQGKKEIFLDRLKYFPEELVKWCKFRGLGQAIPENWPTEGSIVVSQGAKGMEIEAVDPDHGDSWMKLDRVWGLRLKASSGSSALLSCQQDGWKSWNHLKPGWEEIDFGEYMNREMSSYFGINNHPAFVAEELRD